MFRLIPVFAVLLLVSGCFTTPTFPDPSLISSQYVPTPIEDGTGQYISPYTSDGTVALWLEKSINAEIGAQLGATAGSFGAQTALESVPVFGAVGSILGEKVGREAGRQAAIASFGGETYMRENSDLSFNSLEDLAVYTYVNHSEHAHYAEAISAMTKIYPKFDKVNLPAIQRAADLSAQLNLQKSY